MRDASTSTGPSRAKPHDRARIRAKDIMTRRAVAVQLDTPVRRVAELLMERRIGGVPVMDHRHLVGIVTESDLICRDELGTGAAGLAEGLLSNYGPAALPEANRVRGAYARDVMSRPVTTIEEGLDLVEVVRTMLAHHVKRLPVMSGETLVGIVSRSDIVRALVNRPPGASEPREDDDDLIRYRVIETLIGMPGTSPWQATVEVSGGVVRLGGAIEDETARDPSREAIERLPHVVEVVDHRSILNPYI